MGKTEIIAFVIVVNIILLVFITGAVLFVMQYRKRRLYHEREKKTINELHQKELLATQLEIQQQTMQDIGREIHDNVGQKLTLASLYSQQLDYEGKYPEIKEKIFSIGDIINDSLNELRSLSKSLTSSYIADTPLTELLQNECGKVTASGKCKVLSDISAPGPLPPLIKTIVVRIVQEFLQNSIKHAVCTTIRLSLKNNGKGLLLGISDDGKGFDTDHSNQSAGIGLQNMKRRAELIGAFIEIKSELSKGTQLKLLIPSEKLNQQV